jgi:hypothetical protein
MLPANPKLMFVLVGILGALASLPLVLRALNYFHAMPPNRQHPIGILWWSCIGTIYLVLWKIDFLDFHQMWMIGLLSTILATWVHLSAWIAFLATNSHSYWLQLLERIRSYIANEPASFDKPSMHS